MGENPYEAPLAPRDPVPARVSYSLLWLSIAWMATASFVAFVAFIVYDFVALGRR